VEENFNEKVEINGIRRLYEKPQNIICDVRAFDGGPPGRTPRASWHKSGTCVHMIGH